MTERADVVPAFRAATGLDAPGLRADRIEAGYSHENWRVEDAGGRRWTVKVGRRQRDPAAMAHQVAMQRLAASHGLRVAEVAGFDSRLAIDERPFLVQRWVAGADASESLPAMAPSARERFAASLGRELARLHAIPGQMFETGFRPESRVPAWSAFVRHQLAVLRALHLRHAVVPVALTDAAFRRCGNLAAQVGGAVAPGLTHRDLHLPNVLVGADGGVAALLDFEHARWTDPAWDFVKLELFLFHEHPDTAAPFLAAYRAARGPAADSLFGPRLDLCRGLEYLRALPYFGAEFPDAGMFGRMLAATRSWLAGG